MTVDAAAIEESLGGLWGSRDPHEHTVKLLNEGIEPDELMLIDGDLVSSSSGSTFENINPATEEVMGVTADATSDDVDRAIAAARRAFDESAWSTDAEFRRHCLHQFGEAMARYADTFRVLAVREAGIALRTTYTFHSDFVIDSIPYWADMATEYQYEFEMPHRPWAAGTSHRIRREPVGVVAAITPWNFPITTAMFKLMPALASGCTAVLKPAPNTPWHATLIARLIAEETDIPPGVINVVTPSDNAVAEQLTTDIRVDLVHFTGSTRVGRMIMSNASSRLAHVALELGGKSANIILDDADFQSTVPLAAAMVCMYSGQGCVLPTRMLVPRANYEQAVELAALGLDLVKHGDPADPQVIQGPQISRMQQDRILGYIDKGIRDGARLVMGGGKPTDHERGYFVEPTLFADVDPDSTIAQEEIFGPVLAMIPYDSVDDAVQIANNSTYGLAGSVIGSDTERAIDVARQVRSGMLTVNGGFFYGRDIPTGGYKQSGLGRESGLEGFEEFLETKVIAVGT